MCIRSRCPWTLAFVVQEAYERLDAREQRARKQEADLADAKQAAQVGSLLGSQKSCRPLALSLPLV